MDGNDFAVWISRFGTANPISQPSAAALTLAGDDVAHVTASLLARSSAWTLRSQLAAHDEALGFVTAPTCEANPSRLPRPAFNAALADGPTRADNAEALTGVDAELRYASIDAAMEDEFKSR